MLFFRNHFYETLAVITYLSNYLSVSYNWDWAWLTSSWQATEVSKSVSKKDLNMDDGKPWSPENQGDFQPKIKECLKIPGSKPS